MRSRTRSTSAPETFSIWTSFTDLMSNAFMVMTLLLLLALGKAKNDQQIIIELPATKYFFELGSAVLPNNLKKDISGKDGIILKEIKKQIKQIEQNNNKVEVIEVIGHTDGIVVRQNSNGKSKCNLNEKSSLDEHLEEVANAKKDENINILYPCSNTDLGLMRALAVIKELQTAQQGEDERFKKLRFRPYSAAQLLLPENKGFATTEQRNEDLKRRRIEIRFAQLGQYITPGSKSK